MLVYRYFIRLDLQAGVYKLVRSNAGGKKGRNVIGWDVKGREKNGRFYRTCDLFTSCRI